MTFSYHQLIQRKRLLFSIFFFFSLFLSISSIAYAQTVVYSTGFETAPTGWTINNSGNGTWARGNPNNGGAHGGTNVYATNLTGNFSSSDDSNIESPVIAIPSSGGAASLSFWEKRIIDDNSGDYVTVEIKVVGGSYAAIFNPGAGVQNISSWTQRTVSIPDSYKGQNVQVRFRFRSDYNNTDLGWYLDDFALTIASGGTISGNVKQNVTNANVSGVTITIRNSGSTVIGTTTTDISGNYSIFVPVGTNYTITPTLTDYTFTPTVTTVSVTDGGTYTNRDFTVDGNLLTGNVKQNVTNANVSGVTINVTGTASRTTTTDVSGNYSIFLPVGTYTATPVLTGFSFTPTNSTAIPISNASGAARNFTVNGGVVTGTITSAGGPLSGITVNAGSYSATTNGSGVYTFFLPAGTYTVTPTSGTYNFSPTSSSVTVTNGSTSTQNFYGSNCGRIYGTVTIGGNAAQYFPVHLTGYQNRTVLTNSSGFYEFTDLPAPNVCGGGNVTSVNYVVSVQPHVETASTNDLYHTVALGSTTGGINQQHDFNPDGYSGSTFDLSGNIRAIIGISLQNQDGVNVVLERNRITDTHVDLWESAGTVPPTGVDGNFAFPGLLGRYQYRLIVSKPGFYYEPTDESHRLADQGYIYYIDIPGPRPNQDFIGTPKTYKITGNVTAETTPGGAQANKSNVLITLYNSPGADLNWNTYNDNIVFNTQLTDASGNYSFDAPVSGNYMISATLAGYAFTGTPPITMPWLNLTENKSQNFTGTLVPYNLTGSVTNLLAGVPYNHQARVRLYETTNLGTPIASVLTGPGTVNYDFLTTKLYVNKQYIVNVEPFTGYSFTPTQVEINNPAAHQEADFVAIRTNLTIKGYVTGVNYSNPNIPLTERVKLDCPGSIENEVYVLGNGSEEYTFTVLAFGTYTVTPSMAGHNFTPAFRTSTTLSSSLTDQNFVASIRTFTLSGKVVDDSGNPVAGVSMGIDNTGNIPGPNIPATAPPVVTGVDGLYSYTVNARQNYLITPTKSGVTIVPATRQYYDIKSDSVQFFFTTVLKTWKVIGYVTKGTTAGSPVSGATVSIKIHGTSNVWSLVASDATGKYEFLGVQGGSYDITGSKAGFNVTSTPTPVEVLNLGSDVTIPVAQNLVASPIRNSITGAVSGLGVGENATVSLQVERPGPVWTTVTSVVTNNNFIFNSAVEVDSNYRVIATSPGYTIYPPDGRVYSNPISAITNANFNVATDVLTIRGQVTGLRPADMPVTISCVVRSGGTGTVITPAVVTDASGNYTLTVSANGNYRVTPSRLGYDFTPTGSDVDVVSTAITGVNFVGTLRTHTVSGTVSGFLSAHGPAHIIITPAPVAGSADQAIATPGGSYTCTLDEITNYTITANLPGYSFTPPQRIYVNNTTNHLTDNYLAIINKITISGTVTLSGSPLQGAVISCTSQTNKLTDASGNYAFTVDAFSDNTVSAYLAGYSFTPSQSPIFNNISSDKDLDFTATRTTNGEIKGIIYSNGLPLSGAVVALGGYSTSSQTTNGTGTYDFTGLTEHQNYTITVTKSGYTFVPASPVGVNNIVGTVTQDFASNTSAYTISGYVKTGTGTAVEDVILRLNGHDTTTVTNLSGYYSFTVTAGGSYTVSAEKTGYTFAFNAAGGPPVSTTANTTAVNIQSNQVINFTASNDPGGASIAGTIYTGSSPFPSITVNLYKGVGSTTVETTTTSDVNGEYTFTSLEANVTYRVEPVPVGTAFTPVDRTVDNLIGAATGLDFVTGIETKKVGGRITITGGTTGVDGIPVAFRTEVKGASSPNFSSLTVTQNGGYYEADVPVGNTYAIVPRTALTNPAVTDHGYTFTGGNRPSGDSSLTPVITSGSTAAYNFTAIERKYIISGIVTLNASNQTGVTVRLDSGATVNYRNYTTDGSGYTFTVTGKRSYKVYPVSALYNYDPSERSYTDLIGNKPGQNFVATTASKKTYRISGTILLSGSPLPDVVIRVNASDTTIVTNASGYYNVVVSAGGTYTMNPALAGYTFSFNPVGSTTNDEKVVNILADSVVNFSASTLTDAAIRGKVYSSGSLLDGATVRLYKNGALASTQTTAVPAAYSGYSYSFTGLETNQNYEVTVEKAGFTFIPNEDGTGSLGVKYFNGLVSVVEQDFASNVSTKTITGNIHTAAPANIPNVTVNITSSAFNTSAVTGSDGNFTVTVPAGVEYVLTPRDVPDMGYSYVNDDSTGRTTRYSGVVSANVTGMDFLANVKNYTIVVKVTGVDAGDTTNLPDLGAGTVRIIGNDSTTYTVAGLANYTITPSSNEWNYTPSTVTYNNLIGNKVITFNASSKKLYTVSGTVTRFGSGTLEGVVLSINPGSQTVSTNSSGVYSFDVNAGTSYTITPSNTTGTGIGYNFEADRPGTPDSTAENVKNNVIINFIAKPVGGLTISGKIYNNGALLDSATVSLIINDIPSGSTVKTHANGEYEFVGLTAHSKYEVTVHKDGFAFIPNGTGSDGYKLFNDMIVSQIQDFASNTSASVINGDIYTYNGSTKASPVANIPLVITSSSFNTNAVTGADGTYTAQVPVGLEYKITPISNPDQGYHFTNSDTIANLSRFTGVIVAPTVNGMNFRADTNRTYSITGIISGVLAGNNVMVRLYDITSGSNIKIDSAIANSGSSWVYTFAGVTGLRNYFIVPDLTNYAFNPNNRTLLNLIGNKSGQNFTATNALGPILVTPDNGDEGVTITPTFSWLAPPVGATPTNYKIQVSTSSDFTGAMEYSGNVLNYNGFTLSNATVYFWRVQSQSISGNNWSEVWSFTTNLSAPTLNTPVCGSTTSINPTLTWNVVPLATLYDVELKNMTTLVTAQYNNLTATNINITNLTNFTSYQWRVRAKNSGSTSNYSAWCAFTTDASIPALKSPISGSVGQPLNLTFEWFPVVGATTYTLEYSTNPNFPGGGTTIVDVNGTTKAVTGLVMNSTYFWRVKVKLPVPSNYSEVWYFSVGGAFSWNPANLDYGNVLVGKTTSQKVTVTNNGSTPIRIYLNVDGNQFNSPNVAQNPIDIPAGSNKEITVNFAPTSTGLKTGKLQIQHNVASQPLNPVEIPLTGTGVSTFANMVLPALIDFGAVIFNSGSRDTIIMLYNNSTIAGDNLTISPATFETPTGIFQVIPQSQIILEPGTTADITVRFTPNALGIQQNAFHLLNTSLNPDAKVIVRANVQQGDLVVTPSYVDFGNTTRAIPYKDTTVAIQNNSAQAITLTGKFLSGDTSSYSIDNPTQIILQPNQTDYVKVRFFPRTAGRKTAIFNIHSNYLLAPALYVPLTGVGGEEPVLFVDMQTIDFGMMRNGQIKDTTVTIRNDGSLDLNVTSKEIIGTDKTMFSFVNDGQPITLRSGESRTLILRATASLPIGGKTAQVQMVSNDPNNGTFIINLLASVRSNVLFKSADRIIFDTVDVGYYVDTTFILRNDGDLNAVISRFELDGPYASDFKILNVTVPFDLAPSESKVISLRFAPTATGIRYAQILLTVDDPSDPDQRIIVQGWGRDASPDVIVVVDGNPSGNPELDFGRVPIFETRSKEIGLKNLSKYGKLRIDAMYIDSIYKQPFSFGDLAFPLYITSGELRTLVLTFNPKDKVRTYGAFLYIQYSDSTLPPNKNNVLKVKMTGAVIFPGMEFELTPVLKFGKVIQGQALNREYVITNLGESYLTIDSIVVSGEDKGEFTINEKLFPIRIEKDLSYTSSVTFKAAKVGSKDAIITVFSNDLYKLGQIEIWAECVLSGQQTTGILKTDEIPTSYALNQNYPNPFNPSTKIEYSIPEASHVTVSIYNSLGQEVAKLVNETQSVGKYIIDWQAKNLPSGIYFYKMQSSKFSAFKKMVLIK